MNFKKFLIGAAAGAILFGTLAVSAFAAAPNWNITGTWNLDFSLGSGHYLHTMNVASFDPSTGVFSGTGTYNPDLTYTWTITGGTVNGNNIAFDILYTGTNAGYISHVIGTIASATSMNGTWNDVNGASGEWIGTGTAIPVLVGPPTDNKQCGKNGWKTFNNPTFTSQRDCEKYIKDHREDGKANGDIRMSNPSQRIKFDLSEKDTSDFKFHHRNKLNKVEYWNYDYPGILHYKVDVLCVDVNKMTKEARFMFQIPDGWPGLTGLYVVAYVKDVEQRKTADLYGHAATSDLITATAWCETGVGFNPTMYPVTKGKVEVN